MVLKIDQIIGLYQSDLKLIPNVLIKTNKIRKFKKKKKIWGWGGGGGWGGEPLESRSKRRWVLSIRSRILPLENFVKT